MPCLKASKASRSCVMQLAEAASPSPVGRRSCRELDVRNAAAKMWRMRSFTAGCMVGKTMSWSSLWSILKNEEKLATTGIFMATLKVIPTSQFSTLSQDIYNDWLVCGCATWWATIVLWWGHSNFVWRVYISFFYCCQEYKSPTSPKTTFFFWNTCLVQCTMPR